MLLSTPPILTCLIFIETHAILQERKLRHREVRLPILGHSAGNQQMHASSPGNLVPEYIVLSVYNFWLSTELDTNAEELGAICMKQ